MMDHRDVTRERMSFGTTGEVHCGKTEILEKLVEGKGHFPKANLCRCGPLPLAARGLCPWEG